MVLDSRTGDLIAVHLRTAELTWRRVIHLIPGCVIEVTDTGRPWADGGAMTITGARNDARHLTRREETVLVLVGRGLSTRAIAERLALSPATIDGYVDSAMTRLAARTRAQAALMVADPAGADSVAPFAEIQCEHERHLLLLLASGSTVGSAAWTVGWSRRTAVRRLSALRRAYRASTIPQLLVALASGRAAAAAPAAADTDTDGRDRHRASARAGVRP